jgi:hypothetical protein
LSWLLLPLRNGLLSHAIWSLAAAAHTATSTVPGPASRRAPDLESLDPVAVPSCLGSAAVPERDTQLASCSVSMTCRGDPPQWDRWPIPSRMASQPIPGCRFVPPPRLGRRTLRLRAAPAMQAAFPREESSHSVPDEVCAESDPGPSGSGRRPNSCSGSAKAGP